MRIFFGDLDKAVKTSLKSGYKGFVHFSQNDDTYQTFSLTVYATEDDGETPKSLTPSEVDELEKEFVRMAGVVAVAGYKKSTHPEGKIHG